MSWQQGSSQPEALAGAKGPVSRFGKALERRVLGYVQRHSLLSPGERALVGVSGGPDSTALLLILGHLRETLGIQLAVAHFDHGLRSRQEAIAEAAYVSGLAQSLGLPLVQGEGDVRGQARAQGLSLEEAARRLRYAFFAREADRLVAGVVAVGHTASDQAETVLLHILRGSGLEGLAAMAPRSSWPFGLGPALVRPLLAISRRDTERYCREEGIAPRQDPSNLLLEATRNRVRHHLLPLLRQFNPRIEGALSRLAAAAALDAACLDELAAGLWPTVAREGEASVSFPRQELAALLPALVSRLLGRAARHLAGPEARLEAVHLAAALDCLQKRRARLSLPHGLLLVLDQRHVRLTQRGEEVGRGAAALRETRLAIPGSTQVGPWLVEAELIRGAPPSRVDPLEAFLDAEAVGGELTVRSRRPGDRLRPLGLGGEKKVQDILVDAKVSLEERDAVPLVCAPWGIAWVVGHRIDERARVRPETTFVLHLRFLGKGVGNQLDRE